MAEPLVVTLLGPPRFSRAQAPVACASRKALGVFVYVVLSSGVHARREVAALFWGRRDEETARASLRVALHRLPPAMAECLAVDRDSISLAPNASPRVDLVDFESLARNDDVESLERASELYQGELLQDFDADATPEFDDWLHAQRTRVSQLAQQVFDGAISHRANRARQDAARASSERESALAMGRRWVALMPGAEAAHRWLMQLYLDIGRRDAALTQYELCQRFLAVSYGRAPTAQTRDLYETALGRAISSDAADAAEPATPADAVARSLVPSTSFVGRIEELAELDRLLADPHCRLLTLHGLGGAGKTRLAHALATQIGGRFAQGVAWVALDAVEPHDDALPIAIANVLRRELPAQGDYVAIVADMLAGQQRLLVLDNMESLLTRSADPIAMVTRILERAPGIRIVATSREVLGLQEEWIYDVQGLTFDPSAATTPPAVELFAQRARQTYLGFSLPAEMPHVLRICALVEGLPLGLELAAAWVRTIPCGEIAAAIEREGVALASPHRNRRRAASHARSRGRLFVESPAQRRAARPGGTVRLRRRLHARPVRTGSGGNDAHPVGARGQVARATSRQRPLRPARDRAAIRVGEAAQGAHARSRGPAASCGSVFEPAAAVVRRGARSGRGRRSGAPSRRFRQHPGRVGAVGRGRVARSRRADGADTHRFIALAGAAAAGAANGEQAIAALGKNARRDVECAVRLQCGRAAVAAQPEVAERELDAALALARSVGKPAEIRALPLLSRRARLPTGRARRHGCAGSGIDVARAKRRGPRAPGARTQHHRCRSQHALATSTSQPSSCGWGSPPLVNWVRRP